MSENVANGGNLSTPQRKAIEALAAGATKEQAATVANRTERTIRRWIAEDEGFRAALKAATSAAVTDAARRLAGLLAKALTALENVLESTDASDRDRLRAVDMTVKHAVKMTEFAELEERITALEESMSDGQI